MTVVLTSFLLLSPGCPGPSIPGPWASQAKIKAAASQPDEGFGFSVSVSGDYAIAGAYSHDRTGTGADVGIAHIFHRTGANSWDAGTPVEATDPGDGDYFGRSVAIDGDYAIVGAYAEDGAGANLGAAYVFHRTDVNTWDGGVKIAATDAADDDTFGWSVGISGNYAVVGAYLEDGTGTERGAAYVFARTDAASWDGGTKLPAFDAADYDWYGHAVSISGDSLISGAYCKVGVSMGQPYNGAAYVIRR